MTMNDHYSMMAADSIRGACYDVGEASRRVTDWLCCPSAVYKPRVFRDGSLWCALYGEDLQMGVAGFGASPALACEDFDREWQAIIPEPEK